MTKRVWISLIILALSVFVGWKSFSKITNWLGGGESSLVGKEYCRKTSVVPGGIHCLKFVNQKQVMDNEAQLIGSTTKVTTETYLVTENRVTISPKAPKFGTPVIEKVYSLSSDGKTISRIWGGNTPPTIFKTGKPAEEFEGRKGKGPGGAPMTECLDNENKKHPSTAKVLGTMVQNVVPVAYPKENYICGRDRFGEGQWVRECDTKQNCPNARYVPLNPTPTPAVIPDTKLKPTKSK